MSIIRKSIIMKLDTIIPNNYVKTLKNLYPYWGSKRNRGRRWMGIWGMLSIMGFIYVSQIFYKQFLKSFWEKPDFDFLFGVAVSLAAFGELITISFLFHQVIRMFSNKFNIFENL